MSSLFLLSDGFQGIFIFEADLSAKVSSCTNWRSRAVAFVSSLSEGIAMAIEALSCALSCAELAETTLFDRMYLEESIIINL